MLRGSPRRGGGVGAESPVANFGLEPKWERALLGGPAPRRSRGGSSRLRAPRGGLVALLRGCGRCPAPPLRLRLPLLRHRGAVGLRWRRWRWWRWWPSPPALLHFTRWLLSFSLVPRRLPKVFTSRSPQSRFQPATQVRQGAARSPRSTIFLPTFPGTLKLSFFAGWGLGWGLEWDFVWRAGLASRGGRSRRSL